MILTRFPLDDEAEPTTVVSCSFAIERVFLCVNIREYDATYNVRKYLVWFGSTLRLTTF